MRNRKFISLLSVILVISVLLTACGGKEELEVLQQENAYLKQRVDELTAQIGTSTITESVVENSVRQVDGENRLRFEKIEGALVFPNSLTLPNSKDDVNNSYIQIGTFFRYKPSNNWVTRLSGTTLELSHPSKISGVIKSISVKERILEGDMQGLLQSFYKGFPSTTVKYRKIYIEDLLVGMTSTADIDVEGKPHTVNVGFVNYGETGILFLVQNEKNETGVHQELIDTMLKSIAYMDRNLILE